MPQSNWWDNPSYYIDEVVCYYDIPAILSEHSKRIIKELEGMKTDEEGMGTALSMKRGWNDALGEAIKKVGELGD